MSVLLVLDKNLSNLMPYIFIDGEYTIYFLELLGF